MNDVIEGIVVRVVNHKFSRIVHLRVGLFTIYRENGCIICGEDACVACDDNFNWHPSGDICCSEDAG